MKVETKDPRRLGETFVAQACHVEGQRSDPVYPMNTYGKRIKLPKRTIGASLSRTVPGLEGCVQV